MSAMGRKLPLTLAAGMDGKLTFAALVILGPLTICQLSLTMAS